VSGGWTHNLIEASGLRNGEQVLVVVDEPLAEQGAELTAAVVDAGGNARLELWRGTAPVEAARRADLLLYLQQEPQPDEADERMALTGTVRGRGGRALFLGFVDRALLEGELSEPVADFSGTAHALLAQLEGAREVRVTSPAGTELTLRVEGRPWTTDAGVLSAGGIANFPSGEVFVAPHRDGADGVLVADLTVPYTVDGRVDEPIRLTFERGRVSAIEGGRAAGLLRRLVAAAGAGADVIAELGIGFNPSITPRGHVMLDEKAAGTAHVAIGRNTAFAGGDNESSIHVDCIFGGPVVQVDGRPLRLP